MPSLPTLPEMLWLLLCFLGATVAISRVYRMNLREWSALFITPPLALFALWLFYALTFALCAPTAQP